MAESGIHHNRKNGKHYAENGLSLQQAVVVMLFFGMLVSTGSLLFLIQSKGASLFGGRQEKQSVAVKNHDLLDAPSVSRMEYQAKLDKAQTHLKELENAFRKDREDTIREHSLEAEQQADESQGIQEVSSLLSQESREKLIQAKHELKLINKTLSHLKKSRPKAPDSQSADIPVSDITQDAHPAASDTELPEQSFILGDTAYTSPAQKDYQKIRINSDADDDIQPATLDSKASETPLANNPPIPFLPPEAEPSLGKLSSSSEQQELRIEAQVLALQKKLLKTEIEVLEIESEENKTANKLIQPTAWHNSKQFYAKQARQAKLEESLKQLKSDILDLDTIVLDTKPAETALSEKRSKNKSKKESSGFNTNTKAFSPNHARVKSNPLHELAGYQAFPNRDISYNKAQKEQLLTKANPSLIIKPLVGETDQHAAPQNLSPVTTKQVKTVKKHHEFSKAPDWRKKAFKALKTQVNALNARLKKIKIDKHLESFWPWTVLLCFALGIGFYRFSKQRKANATYIANQLPSPYPGILPWISKHQWKYHREHKRLELVTELIPEFNQAVEDYTRKLQRHRQESTSSVLLASAINDNEGQESLIGNLALSLAQHGEKVLLIDANLEAPKLQQAFNHELDYERGLPELLNWIAEKRQHAQLSLHLGSALDQHLYDFITSSGLHENLHYLNAGCSMPESLSFFQDQGLQTLINSCKHFYDWVIINAPPLLKQPAEVEALSLPVDGLLLLVERHSSERKIQKASEQIEALNCPVFATVRRS